MTHNLTGVEIRKALLEVIEEYSGKGPGYFQQNPILNEAAKKLDIRGDEDMERALLTAWYDQFSEGHLAWGHNLDNPGPPHCHITDKGRETLSNISRDPANRS